MTLFAQITDTHIIDPASDEERYVDNEYRLAEAVESINVETVSVDAVVATGDLTNWGKPVEYELLKAGLAPLEAQLLPLPGNHDDRSNLKSAFPDMAWVDGPHASWSVDFNEVRLVGLDSTRAGHDGAAFDEAREEWLSNELAEAESKSLPVLLALHHPPFRTGIGWMDKAGFVGLDRLVGLLHNSPVIKIICGHLHRPICTVVAGIPAQVGISTVQHVALDLSSQAPITLINDPPGYMLHDINSEECVTHTRYIATGESAYVPSWAKDSSN